MTLDYQLSEIKELENQEELISIIQNPNLDDLRRSAAASNYNLNNKDFLKELASNINLNYKIRRGAIKNLNLDDQSLFIDIGLNDENIQIRRAAIKRITDQDTLTIIARESLDFASRLIAVEKISDIAVRLDIAVKDSNDLVSFKAVDLYPFLSTLNSLFYNFNCSGRYVDNALKLIDFIDLCLSKDFNKESHDALNKFKDYLNDLINIKLSDLKEVPYHLEKSFSRRVLTNMAILTWDLAFAIIDYTEDDYELLKIFNVQNDIRIRLAALKKIKSEHFLIDIVSNFRTGHSLYDDTLGSLQRRFSYDLDECLSIHKFTQEELIDLAVYSGFKKTRRKVVKYIEDMELLEYWALNDSYTGFRREIVSLPNFNNKELLSKLVFEDDCDRVRLYAVRKINDQEILSKLAVDDSYWAVREEAVSKIRDESILIDRALNDPNVMIIIAALKNPNLNDRQTINKIGSYPNLWVTKIIAEHPLTDDETLIDIALNNPWNYPREKAIERIYDKDVLKYIAENDKDPWISLISESRLRKLDENENE